MVKRIAQIIVLAEDLNQFNFARRFLERKGHHRRTIYKVPLPQGRGSGEQHVREQYPGEVRRYRAQSSRRKAALVVLIDADMKTVAEREGDLQSALRSASQDPRQPSETIVLLIPKRHIETWIYCLLGERVEESKDYRNRGDVQEKIKPAAQTFCEWSRPHYVVPVHCVESLQRGLSEVQRIP